MPAAGHSHLCPAAALGSTMSVLTGWPPAATSVAVTNSPSGECEWTAADGDLTVGEPGEGVAAESETTAACTSACGSAITGAQPCKISAALRSRTAVKGTVNGKQGTVRRIRTRTHQLPCTKFPAHIYWIDVPERSPVSFRLARRPLHGLVPPWRRWPPVSSGWLPISSGRSRANGGKGRFTVGSDAVAAGKAP